MRGAVASRCRALAPWLAAIALALAAIALCVRIARSGEPRRLGALDFPALALFGLTLLAVPGGALALAYRAHAREGRQRSEVESLLAIMRDVHAAAGTEAAAGVLLEHARSLVGATGAALVLHTAEGRVLRAQVDGRERARRSLTGETTPPERTLFEELAFTAVIDLSNTRQERRTGLDGPRPAGRDRRRAARRDARRRAARRRAQRVVQPARAAAAGDGRRARRQRARERPDGACAGRA